MIHVAQHRALAPLTTLELGGAASRFVRIDEVDDLRDLLRATDEPVRILGGGSNLVVADAGVTGTVVQLDARGLSLQRADGRAILTAQAGETWQSVVDLALDEQLSGVECLTGIPGRVGAVPIQNVGAYGQEVADTLIDVQVMARDSGQVRWLPASACGFGYRDSAFKRDPDRYIVLAVRFVLTPKGLPCVRYAELQRALGVSPGGALPSLREVADTVWSLRARKSMVRRADDPNRRSAGSFFTNPVVSRATADDVTRRARAQAVIEPDEQLPQFATGDGQVKLAAAWLIERAGFHKGYRRGAVGISSQHALALVHHGGGTTAELLALAREIRAGVEARFGVTLCMEPTCWGTSLST